jgi:aryl-alcohol dehydrogenase-like predicted oxidoreductase
LIIQKRKFGNTDLLVSEIGFGAWAIGGPAMAGDLPIGWGMVDDAVSLKALRTAYDRGVNFFDTADFYGFGHSEELIGKTFGNKREVIIATKVGHRLSENKKILFDYSKKYILSACEQSLSRLKRDCIDYYQLHTAKVADFLAGECLEAMEQLKDEGKIRFWGISLNTYHPFPEADFMMSHQLGSGFQLVFNIINQRARDLIEEASKKGYGIIARMPLQFGLLAGKINEKTRFEKDDHRHFRLNPHVLRKALKELETIWSVADKYKLPAATFSLNFVLSVPEISTVIPGIKTSEQAISNTTGLRNLEDEDLLYLFEKLLDFIEAQEG